MISVELRQQFFRQMLRIRAYEAALQREYHADKAPAWDIGAGLIPGEMHLSAGQEPVAVGLCSHLEADDALTATHRPHHLALAKGVDMKAMTAEIFGRKTGLCGGKGGHMHLFDPSQHFSCSGIIAEGMPVAVGQGMALHRRGTRRVAAAVAGEGAANQGAFHEALNLASMWKLPVVFVIEDNDWAISVARDSATPIKDGSLRAQAYGMPGRRVEGNDVEAIYEACGVAVDRARNGGGPTLLEVHTVRLWGHFEGDAQAYRGDELADAESRDPIPAYRTRLLQAGVLSESDVDQMETDVAAEVEEAIAYAKASPAPSPADLYTDVFA